MILPFTIAPITQGQKYYTGELDVKNSRVFTKIVSRSKVPVIK